MLLPLIINVIVFELITRKVSMVIRAGIAIFFQDLK